MRCALLVVVGLLAVSCAPGSPGPNAPASSSQPSEPLPPVAAYLPLESGRVLTYAASSGSKILARTERKASGGTLVLPGGPKSFRFEQGGILITGGPGAGTYALMWPIQMGATWEGPGGPLQVTAVDASVTVPAGEFTGCVETTEDRKASRTVIRTAFCPNMGIVRVTTERSGAVETAELVSAGEGVTIEPN